MIYFTNVSFKAKLTPTSEIAPDVFIGDYVSMGYHSYVQKENEILSANIGNFCSIGTNCHIGMFEHPIYHMSTSSRLYLKVPDAGDFYNDIPNPVNIGHDVWVGSNSTVLGGVTIGNGAVVGDGAVVNKDVPPYAVVVGVPAKIIKYRFDDEKIASLEQMQWWNMSDDELRQKRDFFKNKE